MSVIENFAVLSAKEQLEFATALLNTINTESTFTSDTNFEFRSVEADELTGGLWIEVSQTNPIEVLRKATWTCDDADDANEYPGFEANYKNSIYEDTRKAFKTLSTVIDGYKVSLEISDVDEGDGAVESVDDISHENAGIGDYEYWGDVGYDSQPYVEVTGTIVRSCDCSFALSVEPNNVDETETEPEIEIED